LDDIVVKKLSIDCKPTDLSEWDSVVNKLYSPEAAVDIAMYFVTVCPLSSSNKK
jgi:CTP synthase